MLELFPGDFVNAVRMVAVTTQSFAQIKHEGAQRGAHNVNYTGSSYFAEQMVKSLDTIKNVAAGLDLPSSEASARQARDLIQACLDKSQSDGISLVGERFHRVLTHLSQINLGLQNELSGRIALVLSLKDVGYYASDAPLFEKAVFAAFSSANDDIVEAGKCLAVGRGTACVMHLMRVAEVGLKGLAKSLDVGPQNDWGSYLREIDKELGKRTKSAGARTHAEQFYAETATSFDHLRRAWRNSSMHIDRSYSQERAEEILQATKSFLRRLADNNITE
jgi:hypothetical protein